MGMEKEIKKERNIDMVNSNFYANIGVNAGFTSSRSNSNAHTESAVVTTMKPLNENSSITYNNVNNIMYQGTQAQGGTFIYNDVENINKEAVELHNSYSSNSKGFGISANMNVRGKGDTRANSPSISISANRSNSNTEQTIYQNGRFTNVEEVHNSTKNMRLSGFNQEGGKVTGNIGKLVVESRQNTSTTTGNSRGIGVGISANGMPSSVTVSGSRTNGNRAFVDNQSSFVVGEGSNLHAGTLENTGAVIGKQSDNNTTFKIDNYIAKNIYNEDTMTTTGGSIGASLGGKPRITSAGFNQDSRDKEGITRNTIVGNVEIQNASGDEINRDLGKANEITKDTHRSTNINVEPQVIEYISNPTKFKEDLEVAILEGSATVEGALKKIDNILRGDDNSDISQSEKRRYEEIKENIIRVKTAPDMKLIAEGDLSDPEVQKRLGIGGRFNPDDPNLPEKIKDRIAQVREQGQEINYFYDKVTGKIYINENADEDEIRAGIGREWGIRDEFYRGRTKPNGQWQEKGTVAGEIAYKEIEDRTKGKSDKKVNPYDFEYAKFDPDSEVTGDKIILREVPDKDGKRRTDVNRESMLNTYINNVRKSAGKNIIYYEEDLKEIENLFRSGKILQYKDLTESEKKDFFKIFTEDNEDKLERVTNRKDGTETVEIIWRANLDNITDPLKKAKTIAVREIIDSKVPIVYQTLPQINIKDKNLNLMWNKTFSAVNSYTPKEMANSIEDISDLVYYDFNRPLGKYIYGVDINKNPLITDYKNKKAIENHELIGHPYDFVQIASGLENINFLNDKNAKGKQEGNVIYLSDKYMEIKDRNGKVRIIAQPFWFDGSFESEVNTLILEELTNNKYTNDRRYNKRSLYDLRLRDKVKIFDSIEEYNKFFNENRGQKWKK